MNTPAHDSTVENKALDIMDLLDDVRAERISDYLTLSISGDGHNTTVSFTTTNAQPETFAAVFPGITASSLQTLLNESAMSSAFDHLS